MVKISYKWDICLCFVFKISFIGLCFCKEYDIPCPNKIFCGGEMLKYFQLIDVFSDSKTFVDMKMRHLENITQQNFISFRTKHRNPSRVDIFVFLNDNFEIAGSELDIHIPTDWKEAPSSLYNIKDLALRKFALQIHRRWKTLGRKMKDDVSKNKELYSFIEVKYPFIISGGHYREMFYWDTYWIILGLLISEMTETAKGMLENLLFIFKEYGIVPKSGRMYSLKISQPPLLLQMAKAYFEFTNDKEFLKNHIEALEKEYDFWVKQRTKTITVDDKEHIFAFYGGKSEGPRPEEYLLDYNTAEQFDTQERKEDFYLQMKAASESGWAVSSRWILRYRKNETIAANIKTTSILPVDLNAILCGNSLILARFYKILENKEKTEFFEERFNKWIETFDEVFWHPDVGSWLDYDIVHGKRRNNFYASNLIPLWTECYSRDDIDRKVISILGYMGVENLTNYPGGIPVGKPTLNCVWDYPNVLPPMVHNIIIGLNNTGNHLAQHLAFEIATNLVNAVHQGFLKTKLLFKTYNVHKAGRPGSDSTEGYGWTNGILLDLMYRYGHVMSNGKRLIGSPKLSLLPGFIILCISLY